MAELEYTLADSFSLLESATAQKAFPGGVLAVGLRGKLILHPFGRLSYAKRAKAVNFNTIYDVASLTKPIITTTAIMLLLQGKRLSLDDKAVKYIPEWSKWSDLDGDPKWRGLVTIRMLLLHSAGFSKRKNSYNHVRGYSNAIRLVMAEPLASRPGSRMEYSDIGFIILDEIIRRITKMPLDVFANRRIFKPLGMESSFFNPGRELKANIAPTEYDRKFRKQLVHGFVHDEKAWAMGGVAGHAGLFSTAPDISKFAIMMLGLNAQKEPFIKKSIKDMFTKRYDVAGASHALGWDVPTGKSSSGNYFSNGSFGHMGFTGTSLWVDPKRKLFVLLLTNRINPSRNNTKINKIRPLLHDLIIRSLDL